MTAVSVEKLYPALKALAFGTFAIHLVAQVDALQSSLPSPLLFPRSYSPNSYLVTVFCALSASLDIMWMKELFFGQDGDRNATTSLTDKKEECIFQIVPKPRYDDEELALPHVQRQQSVTIKLTYLPFYIVSNIYFSTNIGLNVLFIWRTWSILNKMENPSVVQLVAVSAFFLLATISSGPDPILGLSILYVLFSLIFGDEFRSTVNSASVVAWQSTFRLLTIGITVCLAIEFIMSKRRNFPWLSGWKVSWNRSAAT